MSHNVTVGVSNPVFIDEVNNLGKNLNLLINEVNETTKENPAYIDILKGLHALGSRIVIFNNNLGLLATYDDQAWNRIQQFKLELNEWRSRYVEKGNSTSSSPMSPMSAPTSNFAGTFFGAIPWWVYGGLGLGAIYLFWPESPRSHHKQSS